MHFILLVMLFFQSTLVAIQTDFDVAIVGTSSLAMREATDYIQRNERVLIVETDEYTERIESHANVEITHQKPDTIYIDLENGYVDLALGCRHFTTAKLIVIPAKSENST